MDQRRGLARQRVELVGQWDASPTLLQSPGGMYFPGVNMGQYVLSEPEGQTAMQDFQQDLQNDGDGLVVDLLHPSNNAGHSIACWGFDYDANDPGCQTGIWVSDNNDLMDGIPAELHRLAVAEVGSQWQIVGADAAEKYLIGWQMDELDGLAASRPASRGPAAAHERCGHDGPFSIGDRRWQRAAMRPTMSIAADK